MTEYEAKKKWCPMASNRVVTAQCKDGSIDVSRWDANDDGTIGVVCIASDCMMWVEEDKMVYKEGSVEPEFVKTGHGYCGLIG